jgi:HEAT repeat protein
MLTYRASLVAALLSLVIGVAAFPTMAAPPKSEEQLVQDLSSAKDTVVVDAMQHLEKEYPTSATGIPVIKKLLADPREKVRRKAARVLGSLHVEVSDTDLKNIAEMFKAKDKGEVMDALKSLRGLKAQSLVPEIVALLNNPDKNILRDSCRTLGVLGNKSVIPSIEPLLKHPDPAVQKDAQDAIFALKGKE